MEKQGEIRPGNTPPEAVGNLSQDIGYAWRMTKAGTTRRQTRKSSILKSMLLSVPRMQSRMGCSNLPAPVFSRDC